MFLEGETFLANKLDERQQRQMMKQALYSDSHQGGMAGRPRSKSQPKPSSVQSNVFDYEHKSTDKPSYYHPPAAQTKNSKSGSVVTWLLLGIIIILLGVAAFLVFKLATGGFTSDKQVVDGGVVTNNNPILTQTASAGQGYVDETMFVGDSNFERLRMFQLVDPTMVAAKQGMGVGGITSDAFVQVTGRDAPLTIAQTMGIVSPKRILLMAGTNDIGNISVEEFAAAYKNTLAELKKQAPKAHIVVAAIPPVAWENSGNGITPTNVQEFNQAIIKVCTEEQVPFLNTSEVLAGADGAAIEGVLEADGFHLTQAGMEMMLEYYKTHAWNP